MELQKGANAPVGTGALTVAVDLPVVSGCDADVSAYLVGETGTVRGDHDMVFYNQKEGGNGAVRLIEHGPAGTSFAVDPAILPADIARIVFCVTIDQAQARGQTLGTLGGGRIVVRAGGVEIAAFAPMLAGASEAAMIFGELYRRNGAWKVRAVGQGFDGGLAPLARSFGIEVADEALAAPASPAPPMPAAISLSKVTLDKPGQSISLEKRGGSFGEIVVNLNWSREKSSPAGGVGHAIDLDLGCLYELADGTKFVVQALGNLFGSLDGPPYIKLDGDDRTGDVSKGETLRVNGARWSDIRRIAIFAHIYQGVPNWSATDGVVFVSMPDQPPIEVRMTEGSDAQSLCGVVLLENDRGSLKATRIVRYYPGRVELDRDLGWGMEWSYGATKD